MLELLYHKRNPFLATYLQLIDDIIFMKMFKTNSREKR